MWDPKRYSDNDTIRWAFLRAVEWRDWPLFISQPIVPVALYLYPALWWWCLPVGVIVMTIIWRLDTVPYFVHPASMDFGALFVRMKFITAPVCAFLIWRTGHFPIAIEAFLWPFVGTYLAQLVLIIPMGLISMMPYQKAAQLEIVQARLLKAIGFAGEPEGL